jgi:hypothetical protein
MIGFFVHSDDGKENSENTMFIPTIFPIYFVLAEKFEVKVY